MYDQLASRLAQRLSQVQPLKPQAERQLAAHMAGHTDNMQLFLLSAAEVLEDYEVEIIFGPQFTPTIDDRVAVADLLFHWRPDEAQLAKLVTDLVAQVQTVPIALPDGSTAQLTLHDVMIERYLKLLRLNHAPDAHTAAALRDALPAEQWPLAVALACERGFTPEKQAWFASFVTHLSASRTVSRGLLETVADFVMRQSTLEHDALRAAADALLRATRQTAAYVAGGRAYWSPDVAQHHQYRGQGHVDPQQMQHRQDEVQWVQTLAAELATFAK